MDGGTQLVVTLLKAKLALSSIGSSPFGSNGNSVKGEDTDNLITNVQNSWLYIVAAAGVISGGKAAIETQRLKHTHTHTHTHTEIHCWLFEMALSKNYKRTLMFFAFRLAIFALLTHLLHFCFFLSFFVFSSPSFYNNNYKKVTSLYWIIGSIVDFACVATCFIAPLTVYQKHKLKNLGKCIYCVENI